jgi:hypothetical protein
VGLDAGADLLFCVNPIVPINVQLERHADRLLNVGAHAPGATLADRGLPTVLSQTFRAIVDSRKRTGFKTCAHTHPDADLILIEPECDDTRLFFSNIFSFKNRHDLCEHAYQATRRHLRARTDELQPILGRHGLRLRPDVLEASRSLYDSPSSGQLNTARRSSSVTGVLRGTSDTLDRLDGLLDCIEARTAASTAPTRSGPKLPGPHR